MKAVISNGSYKFHLAPLASELAKTGNLAAFFTAGYPKGLALNTLANIPYAGVKRLIDRRENIPDNLVHAFNFSEVYFKSGDFLKKTFSNDMQHRMHIKGFENYAKKATVALKKLEFDIYHYRDCYGLNSAAWVREQGKKTICDHSIGHPYAISYLLNNAVGLLPESIPAQPLNLLERHFLKDFNNADAILTNSDFVKSTFKACGFADNKIHVVYWGVDDKFLLAADGALASQHKRKSPKNILFCGELSIRKGADQLMEALMQLEDHEWNLTIAGGIESVVLPQWQKFTQRFSNRVKELGTLSRNDLAKVMSEHKVFVFPSLMEGSARVVFEALACGCFVVTTPNSGSIVSEGIHGTLAEAGSASSLAESLLRTWNNEYDIDLISKFNMESIRRDFRQTQYASKVLQTYTSIIDS